MKYFKPLTLTSNEYTYSVDMVRLTFSLDTRYQREVEDYFSSSSRIDIYMYPLSTKEFSYRNLVKVSCGDSSAILGFGFNGCTHEESTNCFAEFNPNKVFPEFLSDFMFLLPRIKNISISRLDLAIDIPIAREYLHLSRFKKTGGCSVYSCSYRSFDNKTEYLGSHNSFGFTKLYNKQIESKLDYILTRLEITTECDILSFQKHIPTVYIDRLFNSEKDCSSLQPLQRALIQSLNLLEFDDKQHIFNTLDFRQKAKLRPYLFEEDTILNIDLFIVSEIFDRLKDFCLISKTC